MSSYFAIYRGWVQYGAERSAAQGAPEALTWDFPAQASVSDDADRAAPVAFGETHHPVADPGSWLAPVRRWAARRVVSEHA